MLHIISMYETNIWSILERTYPSHATNQPLSHNILPLFRTPHCPILIWTVRMFVRILHAFLLVHLGPHCFNIFSPSRALHPKAWRREEVCQQTPKTADPSHLLLTLSLAIQASSKSGVKIKPAWKSTTGAPTRNHNTRPNNKTVDLASNVVFFLTIYQIFQ